MSQGKSEKMSAETVVNVRNQSFKQGPDVLALTAVKTIHLQQ